MWQIGAAYGVETTRTDCANILPATTDASEKCFCSTDFLTESAMTMAKMEEIVARTVDPRVPPPTKTEEEHKMSPGDLAMGTNQNGGKY